MRAVAGTDRLQVAAERQRPFARGRRRHVRHVSAGSCSCLRRGERTVLAPEIEVDEHSRSNSTEHACQIERERRAARRAVASDDSRMRPMDPSAEPISTVCSGSSGIDALGNRRESDWSVNWLTEPLTAQSGVEASKHEVGEASELRTTPSNDVQRWWWGWRPGQRVGADASPA